MGNCMACGFTNIKTQKYAWMLSPDRYVEPKKELCDVCANTKVGNTVDTVGAYENVELMRLIAWGINYLAKQINKQDKKTTTSDRTH